MVALIEYGAGNATSVRKGFRAVGLEVTTTAAPAGLGQARGIVVPGVGNFGATASLDDAWRAAILRRVDAGVPLLGICLGMQWLFEGSDEAPDVPGLGLLAGQCGRLSAERPLKVPHVGWNALALRHSAAILEGVADGAQVYFTHSFAAPITTECSATTTHGRTFAAVVEREHVSGVQFHPEKSGEAGLRVLRNFAALTER